MKYLLLVLTTLLILSGCSRKPQPNPKPDQTSYKQSQTPAKHTGNQSTLKRLYAQYYGWKGTPYRYGGLSKNGVDCSGFVHKAYKSVFNITLPRSTKDQVKQGKRVYINQLHAGDLVFFKTGPNVRHVGIYLEKGKFVHASTSKGVIVSTMYSGYWKNNYWQARRLI